MRFLSVLFNITAFSTVMLAQAPLPDGRAPLKKLSTAAEYQGEILFDSDNLKYSFGGKELVFRKDGTFSVLSGGRELGKSYLFVATSYQYWQTNQGGVLTNTDYDGKRIRVTNIKNEGKKLIFDGKIPWNKKGEPVLSGDWSVTANPVGKGKIQIDWTYSLPEGCERVDSGVFYSVKYCKLLDAGKAGLWTPGTKKNMGSTHDTVLTLEGTMPEDTYRIETPSWSIQEGVRIRGQDGKYTMTVDFSKSHAVSKMKTAGGVDFAAMDQLIIPKRGKNMLPNPYFADRHQFIGTYDYASLKEPLTGTDAKFGRYALNKGGWVRFASIPADAGNYVFSCYAKGKGNLTIYIHSANSEFSAFPSCTVDSPNEWTRYEFPFKFPLNSAIYVEPRFRNGMIVIDGVQLEKGTKATPFEAPAVEACQTGNDFFNHGEKIQLTYELSTLAEKVSGEGKFIIRNFFGEQVFCKDFKFDFSAGQYPKLSFNPENLPDGVYVVKFDFGKTAPEQFFRFSVMPFLKNTHKTARVFSLTYMNGGLKKDYSEKFLERLQQIGIGSNGHSNPMTENVLKLHEKYHVLPFDVLFMDRSSSKGTRLRFPELKNIQEGHLYLYVRNPEFPCWDKRDAVLPDYRLTGGWNQEYRNKMVKIIADLVRKYPKRFAYGMGSEWPAEIKNDPHYIDLYIAYREAVKSVYPDALVYEAGDCNMDIFGGVASYDKLLTRMEGKTVTDFASAHTYVKDLRQLYPNFRAFVEMLNKHKGYEKCRIALPEGMHIYAYNIPGWNCEQVCWMGEGWRSTVLSYDMGWSEKISAALYARCWLVYLTEFDRVYCGTSSAGNVNNFAMDTNLTPRAFQKVPNTLGVLLGNPKRYLGDFSFAPDTKCLVWEDEDGRPIAAVWNEDLAVNEGYKDAPQAQLKYPDAEYIDLMGVSRKPEKEGMFAVTPFPLFIRGKAGDCDSFTKALSLAVLNDPDKLPCNLSFNVQSDKQIKLVLTNPLAREVSGTLDILEKQYKFTVAKNSESSLLIELPQPIQRGKLESLRVPYSCNIQGNIVKNELALNCFTIPKFKGDWNKIPAIQLTNSTKIRPTREDLSATYQMAWDEKKLYLRVNVTDDVFAPGTLPGYRWNYDCVQVYFDTRCSAMRTGKKAYDDDDYEYGLLPTADGKNCEVWRALSPDIQLTLGIGAPKNNTLASEIPAQFTRTANGYVYEVEFPADYVLPICLVPGYNFAFGISVADKDNGKGAEKYLFNTSEPHLSCWNRPHIWPVAVLTE